MRVLCLIPNIYDTSPAQRYRIEQWQPLLKERGVDIDFQAFESQELHAALREDGGIPRKLKLMGEGFARRIKLLSGVREYDVVYISREAALLGPAWIERLLSRTGVPFIYDFDDAIFMPNIGSTGYLSLLKYPSKTRSICRMAAHVVAGNDFLADYARRSNRRVSIVPTTIDTEKYQVEYSRSESDIPVIGWSGSYSTVRYLDTVRSALQRLAQKEKFRLRVIGTSGEYQLDGVDVEAMPWRSETEVADLRPMDIGIMPMPDERWALGKCGLKALQYMGLGIPAVVSPGGVNSQIIRDGENGFHATTEDEWIDKLSLLLRSEDLRRKLGLAGRKTVEEEYSATVQVPRVQRILETVVKGKGKRQ